MIQDKMTLDYWKSQLDEIWLEQMTIIHPGKSIDDAVKQSFGYLISDSTRLENSDASDFKRLVNSWLSNRRAPKPVLNKSQRLNFNDL